MMGSAAIVPVSGAIARHRLSRIRTLLLLEGFQTDVLHNLLRRDVVVGIVLDLFLPAAQGLVDGKACMEAVMVSAYMITLPLTLRAARPAV